MSYESIPDVEQGDLLPTSEVLIQRAQKLYPEAGSAVEAEFLGRLDDAIDNCKAEVKIPRLTVAQLSNARENPEDSSSLGEYMEVVKSLKLPTAALAVTLLSAAIVVSTNNAVTRAIFPYYACVLTFLSSVPVIRKRFLDSITPVFDKMTLVKTGVERKVEGISDKGLNYLGITESAMNKALAPIKEKLDAATKVETMLKQVDPTIDIPDTSDIERSFDGYEDQLKGAFGGMQGLVDISRSLPTPLQSLDKFQMYVVVPFLAFMFVVQIIGVYEVSSVMDDESTEDFLRAGVNGTVGRFLPSQAAEGGDFILNVTRTVDLNSTISFGADGPPETDQWLLMWTAIQAYLTTAITIIVAFLVTQARIIVALTNTQLGMLEGNVNATLREKVGDVFESVFQKGFGSVKAKFLNLVRKVDLVEQPLRKVQAQLGGVGDRLAGVGDQVGEAGIQLPAVRGGMFGKFMK